MLIGTLPISAARAAALILGSRRMKFWQQERFARASKGPGAWLVADDAREIVYRKGQVLVTDDAAQQIGVQLAALDVNDLTAGFTGLAALHLQLLELPQPGDLPAVVDELDAVAAAAGLPPGSVSLNHVMSGEPVYHGGPADVPDSANQPSSNPPDPQVLTPVAAVLDTGMAPHRVNPWMLWGPSDVDSLYLPPVANPEPGDEHLLAAEAGHGYFVGSLLVRFSGGGVVAMRAPLSPEGFCTQAELLCALMPFVASPVPVINLSLGTYTYHDRVPLGLEQVLGQLSPETVVVAAAGNDGRPVRPFWPAAIESVVGVASVDIDVATGAATASSFTNTGEWVDICTQGEKTKGWYPGGRYTVSHALKRNLKDAVIWDGTSFATPVVAGELARRVLEHGVTGAAAWTELAAELDAAGAAGPKGCGRLWDPRAGGVGLDPRDW